MDAIGNQGKPPLATGVCESLFVEKTTQKMCGDTQHTGVTIGVTVIIRKQFINYYQFVIDTFR